MVSPQATSGGMKLVPTPSASIVATPVAPIV
jgi:hypothetical protein